MVMSINSRKPVKRKALNSFSFFLFPLRNDDNENKCNVHVISFQCGNKHSIRIHMIKSCAVDSSATNAERYYAFQEPSKELGKGPVI